MNFNTGDRVRVVAANGGLFSAYNAGHTGTVDSRRDEETVYVRFDSGDLDYGLNTDLELVTPETLAVVTVKEKLEQIEKLLAEIKETLY